MFGRSLTVEVSYCSPKPQEECALVVKGIPDDMDDDSCHQALEMYLNETTGQKVAFCEVVEDVAYIRFQDLSGMYVSTCNRAALTNLSGLGTVLLIKLAT